MVARIGSQIYDSGLVYPISAGSTTDISLDDDVFQFNKVPPYFEMTLELYGRRIDLNHHDHALVNKENNSLNTPAKLVKSIRSIINAKSDRAEKTDFENVGPKFDLFATANLTLNNCSQEIQTEELYPESEASALPLFGQFCFRLAALPYCCEEEVIAGPLKLTLAKNNSVELWASLTNWRLSLWTDKSLKENLKPAYLVVDVNRDSVIRDDGRESLTINGPKRKVWMFQFDGDKNRMQNWLEHLLQHASDHRRWKKAAEERMTVLSPKAKCSTLKRPGMKRTKSHLVRVYNGVDEDGSDDEALV